METIPSAYLRNTTGTTALYNEYYFQIGNDRENKKKGKIMLKVPSTKANNTKDQAQVSATLPKGTLPSPPAITTQALLIDQTDDNEKENENNQTIMIENILSTVTEDHLYDFFVDTGDIKVLCLLNFTFKYIES
ncbi:unnamed protein product [Didymodactylos carnosus]|uniref:Uncharacterized protein n=1 Tax=Didymodactylos carnosus TaxID=1234261 RepID=A0A815EGJ6_9BILA|nr:unnamed protein product [Didymodactylos carnosus]CAF4148688.1 unnamed protein product [Didymodactylos carnosus]